MRLFFVVLFTGIYSIIGHSYVPTLDSLLRNGNNEDINQNTVIANLTITEKPTEPTEQIKTYYSKFVISNFRETYSNIIQLNFERDFTNSSMREMKVIASNGVKNVFTANENLDGEMFYGLLEFLVLNKSKRLLSVLRKYDPGLKDNKELINQDKLTLLKRYKTYLEAQKEDEDNQDLKNPLKPQTEEEQKSVSEIMKQAMILPDENIKRIKIGDEFYFIVDKENMFLKFDKNHRIKEFNFRNLYGGEIEIVFGRFVAFSNALEFPEFIRIKSSSGRNYEIRANKYSMFEDDASSESRRLDRYSKIIEKNNLSSPLFWPEFLL